MLNELPKEFKIVVKNGISEKIQKKLFDLGYFWLFSGRKISHSDKPFLFVSDGVITYGDNEFFFNCQESTEITLQQLMNAKQKEEIIREKDWISVFYELPKIGKEVLVCNEHNNIFSVLGGPSLTKIMNEFHWDCRFLSSMEITHWRPIPEKRPDEMVIDKSLIIDTLSKIIQHELAKSKKSHASLVITLSGFVKSIENGHFDVKEKEND